MKYENDSVSIDAKICINNDAFKHVFLVVVISALYAPKKKMDFILKV